jgi:hypothetical protein
MFAAACKERECIACLLSRYIGERERDCVLRAGGTLFCRLAAGEGGQTEAAAHSRHLFISCAPAELFADGGAQTSHSAIYVNIFQH